jgi:NAD+ kinase
LKLSRIAIVSKEGHGEAREVAKDIALILLKKGFTLTSFPNLHVKGVDHAPSMKEVATSKTDLLLTVSGDGTILRALRTLDSTVPCLCVNVGGRGILSEIKPDQAGAAIDKLQNGNFTLERRIRISSSVGGKTLPPALNEIYILRQSVTRTPLFTIDLGHSSVFSQRMDGFLLTTPTGSTGHSYSLSSAFLQGSLDAFLLTPVASINHFPIIVRNSSAMRVLANHALQVLVDGQDTFPVEADTFITFKKHERDAVFVRFASDGDYRQLKNLGFE